MLGLLIPTGIIVLLRGRPRKKRWIPIFIVFIPVSRMRMKFMPWDEWKEWHIEAVYKLTIRSYIPIIAHIDRYVMHDKKLLNSLFELNVLYQINAEGFSDSFRKKFVRELVASKRAHLLGSDMHNTSSRAPNLAKARTEIIKNYGEDCMDYFISNAEKVVKGDEISESDFISFNKKSFMDKLRKR